MEGKTWEEGLDEVLSEIRAILIKKQHDYGHSNILDFRELGVLVRVNDKVARLKNLLLNKKQAQNESIRDSWRDLAGYAIIALMLENGTFELPLEEDLND
jgi:hypothetical protein